MSPKVKAALARAVRDGTAQSPCCGTGLLWRQVRGVRLYTENGGRRVYSAECSKCRRHHELDGGPEE